ncbi:MAG: hypothetical protein ACO1O6_06960 [Bacteroidota bacterium]
MKTILLSCFVLVMCSFSPKKKQEVHPGLFALSVAIHGTNEEVISGLYIHEDNTFIYFDRSKKKEIKGTWSIVSGDLILKAESHLPVSKKWKIDQNGKCLKGRGKFIFYRSCNC